MVLVFSGRWMQWTLIAIDAILLSLIITRVPYTEVDWSTYISQLKIIIKGSNERMIGNINTTFIDAKGYDSNNHNHNHNHSHDGINNSKMEIDQLENKKKGWIIEEGDYGKIKGDTGPIVYPAAHVYSFWILYWIVGGANQRLFQWSFAVIYMITLYLVMRIYRMARVEKVWPFILLCLGRRIHSIYVLRMFNDCIAMMFLYGAVFCLFNGISPSPSPSRSINTNTIFNGWIRDENDDDGKDKGKQKIQKESKNDWWIYSSVTLYTIALGVKMNILLWLPAMALVIYHKYKSALTMIKMASIIVSIQILLGWPFWRVNWKSYWSSSFQFSRKFLYKWSVNWQFLPEWMFNSSITHKILLLIHFTLLLMTLWRYHLYYQHKKRSNGKEKEKENGDNIKDDYPSHTHLQDILSLFAECGVVGVLCSRSLHYQFYTWYFHMIPFILYRYDNIRPVFRLLVFLILESSWSMYPASALGSILLFAGNISLLIMCRQIK